LSFVAPTSISTGGATICATPLSEFMGA